MIIRNLCQAIKNLSAELTTLCPCLKFSYTAYFFHTPHLLHGFRIVVEQTPSEYNGPTRRFIIPQSLYRKGHGCLNEIYKQTSTELPS